MRLERVGAEVIVRLDDGRSVSAAYLRARAAELERYAAECDALNARTLAQLGLDAESGEALPI